MTHNKSIRQEVIELETYKSNYIQKNYVEGKVIIITGASSGFGKLTAKRAAEMGGKIVLAAEISPATCRLWDKTTKEKLDKDRFRRDLGGVEEAYQEIMKRVMGK